ncbi:MAG: ABC transporter substrate-binding protein [Anaerolineales bacterium]|nr:MAG: ABC transporter substrate-binding protein [Anaerolineales bacterium]
MRRISMISRPIFKRMSFCAFTVLIGIGCIILLLTVMKPAQATPLDNAGDTQEISGTVTLWHAYGPGSTEEAALMQIISNALADNQDLTITATFISFSDIYRLYETEVISGGGPDMFVASNDWLGHEARLGVISNLDDYLQGRLTDVYTTAIEGMKVDGELYGVPESSKAVALYFNKSTITTPLNTTTALLAAVQNDKKLALTTDGAGSYFNFGFFGAFGGELVNESGRCIAKEGGVAPAMQYLVDLVNAGATLITDTWGQGGMPFCAGEIDMYIDGMWDLGALQACLGDDLGLTVIPAGPEDFAKPMTGIDGFYVNPNTTNYTSTVELALFMTNQESAQIYVDVAGHVPVRTDVTISDPLVATFALAAEQGWPRYQGSQMNNYWSPFGDMMTWVLAGDVSPEKGVRMACDKMNWLNGFGPLTFLPFIKR